MKKTGTVFGLDVPFMELLGAREGSWGDGRATLSLELSPPVTNSWGVAHGGVVTALLDTAMGGAALTTAGEGHGVVTTSLSVTFARAGKGALVAEGRVVGSGRSLAFCEGEVRDRDGAVVAVAVGTFKLKRRG